MNRKADLFLDKYRQLEATVAAEYGLSESDSAVGFLLRRPEFRAIRADLEYCREVRNLLTHNPKVQERYPVEPTDEMIALLERTVRRVEDPQRAKHIFVPVEKVCCAAMDDPIRPTMIEMNRRLFAHIPIMDDGVVVGVFSENTLLQYLIDDASASIDWNMTFRDIGKYLPLDQHRAESFRFVGKNILVSDIENIFAKAEKNDDRIGLVFVTNSGKPSEKLLGIISAWDMAGID